MPSINRPVISVSLRRVNDNNAPDNARIISVTVPPRHRVILDASSNIVINVFILNASLSLILQQANQSTASKAKACNGMKNSIMLTLARLMNSRANMSIADTA